MKDKVFETVKKYMATYKMIEPGDYVAAGVSGGADSVCMLHLLTRFQREIPFQMAVVHVNHGVRREAWEDAVFVEELCRKWRLPFFLSEVDMQGYAKEHKLSGEEAGRLLRYRAFSKVLEEAGVKEKGKIAVAHNADDRAETMLFHMFRGSGLKGLGSIRPVRESVIRPLLCLERGQIEAYLKEEGLSFREDVTNRGDVYVRNRVRHHILPYAEKEICAGAVSHMGELADILIQTEDYLEMQTKKLYSRYVKENMTDSVNFVSGKSAETALRAAGVQICLANFRTEDIVMKKRVLLLAIERITPYRKDITARHIESLLELIEKDGSKELFLPYGIRARKEYDRLFLEKLFSDSLKEPEAARKLTVQEASFLPDVPVQVVIPAVGCFVFVLRSMDFWQNEPFFDQKKQNIPENRYTKWFDYDKITTSLLLRTRKPGDYLTIDDALHTQSVKQYMINEKIPKAKRDEMYLLADGSHILWIPGYRISTQYRVGKNTKRILEVRLKGGEDGGADRGTVV